jgi:hypothetical protein
MDSVKLPRPLVLLPPPIDIGATRALVKCGVGRVEIRSAFPDFSRRERAVIVASGAFAVCIVTALTLLSFLSFGEPRYSGWVVAWVSGVGVGALVLFFGGRIFQGGGEFTFVFDKKTGAFWMGSGGWGAKLKNNLEEIDRLQTIRKAYRWWGGERCDGIPLEVTELNIVKRGGGRICLMNQLCEKGLEEEATELSEFLGVTVERWELSPEWCDGLLNDDSG